MLDPRSLRTTILYDDRLSITLIFEQLLPATSRGHFHARHFLAARSELIDLTDFMPILLKRHSHLQLLQNAGGITNGCGGSKTASIWILGRYIVTEFVNEEYLVTKTPFYPSFHSRLQEQKDLW